MKSREKGRISHRCANCAGQLICPFVWSPAVQAVLDRGTYAQGCVIFRQEDVPRAVFVLRSGWLRLSHVAPAGEVTASLVGPGTTLGVAEAVAGSRRQITAETLQECDIEWLEVNAFLSLLKSDPLLTFELLKTISRQILKSGGWIALTDSTPDVRPPPGAGLPE